MALLLSSIGLYGLLAYEVTQRTREVGARMALGALKSDVITAILQRGLSLAAAGALTGVVLGLVLMRLARSMLYGVGVLDPATLIGVAGLLLAVAMAACAVPASRAAKVDPMITLRCESQRQALMARRSPDIENQVQPPGKQNLRTTGS